MEVVREWLEYKKSIKLGSWKIEEEKNLKSNKGENRKRKRRYIEVNEKIYSVGKYNVEYLIKTNYR